MNNMAGKVQVDKKMMWGKLHIQRSVSAVYLISIAVSVRWRIWIEQGEVQYSERTIRFVEDFGVI